MRNRSRVEAQAEEQDTKTYVVSSEVVNVGLGKL